MERDGMYRSSGQRAGSRGRYDDDDGASDSGSGRLGSGRVPLLDLAFGGAALPPLGSARSSREPSESRSSRRWDRDTLHLPRTARAESSGDSREQALMRASVSWHAGNGSSSSLGPGYEYDDPTLMAVQEDDGPALMEATDPELFHAGVLEHARRLGMDPDADRDLLWVARDSLVAPVPPGWYHVVAAGTDPPYYYNEVSGESRWDHPLDDEFRQIYRQLKQQQQQQQQQQQSRRHHDQQYRASSSGYYPANAYQTSAWGEDGQGSISDPGDSQTNEQVAYANGYSGQNWSTGGYYEGYASATATATAYQTAQPLSADTEAVSSGYASGSDPFVSPISTTTQATLGDESPRGGVTVSPYDARQPFSSPEGQQSPNDAASTNHNDATTAKLKAQLADLESQLAERNQALEVSRTDLSELQKALGKLSRQIEASDTEKHEILEANRAMEEELASVREMLDKRAEVDDNASPLRRELAQEQAARRNLTNQLEHAAEEHAATQRQLVDCQSNIARLEQELTSCQLSSKHADEQAAAVSAATARSLQTDLDNKEREAKAAHAQAQALKQEVAELKTAYSNALESAQQTEGQAKATSDELAQSRREASTLKEQLQAAQSEIVAVTKRMEEQAALQAAQLGEAEDQQRALKRDVRSHERELKTLQAAAKEKDQEVAQFKARCESAEAQRDELAQAAEAARRQGYLEAQKASADALRQMQEEKAHMAELYTQEMLTRRKLHNKLMELQGNIRVFCRVRPIQPVEEKSEQCAPAVFFKENDRESLDLVVGGADASGDKANAISQKHAFEFDHVFRPTSSQDDVFEQTRALVVSALDGFNVCIFAYGQTGSGKTHTMEGPPSDRGVNFRSLRELFSIRNARMASGSFECTMKLSILEVYNETVVDLLDSSTSGGSNGNTPSKGLDIRTGKTGVYVDNLIEVEVHNESDVLDLMKLGHSHRSVGAHDFNEHSSRSHLVMSITIEAGTTSATSSKADPSQPPPRRRASKLHLIDLAGSERVSKTAASGQRLKEAQNINRSLSALGDVIAALGANSKHVPYRNSKLTFLLQDSLSGSSKVLMFVNVSPVQWNAWETLCSLNFAARCRNVALGQAKANAAAPATGASSGNTIHSAASTSSMAAAAARPAPMSVPKSMAQQRQAQA